MRPNLQLHLKRCDYRTLCSSVNVATPRAGINRDAVRQVEDLKRQRAHGDRGGLVVQSCLLANSVEENPLWRELLRGSASRSRLMSACLVLGVHYAVSTPPDMPWQELAEIIKKLSFKLSRAGELVGREAARRLGIPFGIIDLSLAPTPVPGDSVANIIEAMGFERAGTHGTTAALALLTDAVKKGGAMASGAVGGMKEVYSVSEDAGMIEAARLGALSLDKLEAWNSVCSVGH